MTVWRVVIARLHFFRHREGRQACGDPVFFDKNAIIPRLQDVASFRIAIQLRG